jgi:hypothetical protein
MEIQVLANDMENVILIETSTSGEITSTSTKETTTAITTTSSPGTNLQCLINHVKKK